MIKRFSILKRSIAADEPFLLSSNAEQMFIAEGDAWEIGNYARLYQKNSKKVQKFLKTY